MKKVAISAQTVTAYMAPTVGRRFLTLKGAAEAEARARIYKMFPSIPYEEDTGDHYDIKWDAPEKYARLHKRLTRAITSQFRKARQGTTHHTSATKGAQS